MPTQSPDLVKYTWHEGERQYRDRFGRFVARTEVRASLDRYLDVLQEEAGLYTQDLADQNLSISQWQLKMESLIKRGHVAATAIAKGGHAQANASDWGEAGAEIRYQYDRLNRFARQLEDGRPVHGGTIARAQMYALAPTSTYERILRKYDLRAGFDREKRILHSEDSCKSCEYYASLGWQPAGSLPDIGTQSECLSRCRCTFQRERSPEARKRRGLSVMPTPMDDKCDRRSRIAGLRDGVEAFPVQLYPSGMRPAFDDRLKFSFGELPGETDAKEMIVESLSAKSQFPIVNADGKKLSLDDIYIHYLEAANSNYIGDRFMFLDASTLKNLAKAGADGIAFMNSHRTGGLSAPAELPFGKSFAGRYEEHSQPDGSLYKRSLLGVYMLRGQYPNGRLQPSTDDLHNAINSRTITDVSIGLGNHGEAICDVCARPLEDKDCNHVPGTTENMNPEQIQAQEARGVTGGKASYSLVNGVALEVSAVYKGAVPGAGFRKAMQFGRKTGGRAASDILAAYGSLMDDGDKRVFNSHSNKGSKAMGFDFLSWLKLGQSVGAIAPDADLSTLEGVQATPIPAPSAAPTAPSQSLAVSAVSNDERAAFELEKRNLKRDQFGVQADNFLLQLKTANKITPGEGEAVKRGYVLAAMDDHFNPLPDEDGKPVSRLEVFKATQLSRKDHGLTTEEITTAEVLPSGEAPDLSKGTPAERLAALLKGTPLGQEIVTALTAK